MFGYTFYMKIDTEVLDHKNKMLRNIDINRNTSRIHKICFNDLKQVPVPLGVLLCAQAVSYNLPLHFLSIVI